MSQPEDPREKASEAGFFCPAYVGLRCVLLFAVLEGHYWFEATGSTHLHPLTFSVPCFFVLSGYLISHTLFQYEDRPWPQAARAFYLRRALRILPPYYIVLAIAYLTRGVPLLAWHATYLFNVKLFLLSAFEHGAFMAFVTSRGLEALHFWSVDVEEQFYLLYPLFIAATFRRARTASLGAGIAICILCRSFLYHYYSETYYGGLPCVAGEYILWGCLLAWLDRQDRLLWLRGPRALYGSMGLFLALAMQDDSYGPYAQWKPPYHATVYAVLLAAFVLALRYSPESLLAKGLRLKPLAAIGRMSYGAYLVHGFLNPTVDSIVTRWPFLAVFPQCPRAVVGPILTLLLAAVLWHGVEQPIDRLRQSFRPRSEAS